MNQHLNQDNKVKQLEINIRIWQEQYQNMMLKENKIKYQDHKKTDRLKDLKIGWKNQKMICKKDKNRLKSLNK